MNVELSLMMVLKSSIRSVIIQSSLRGRIAVSFEIRLLRYRHVRLDPKHEWRHYAPCSRRPDTTYPVLAGHQKTLL